MPNLAADTAAAEQKQHVAARTCVAMTGHWGVGERVGRTGGAEGASRGSGVDRGALPQTLAEPLGHVVGQLHMTIRLLGYSNRILG